MHLNILHGSISILSGMLANWLPSIFDDVLDGFAGPMGPLDTKQMVNAGEGRGDGDGGRIGERR